MAETYWIYTNEGVKVGKFEVDVASLVMSWMTEAQYIRSRFLKACERQNLDASDHNFCLAAE